MKYQIIESNDPEFITEFEAKVNNHIANGWEPLGGVSIRQERRGSSNIKYEITVYAQAMVKNK